jgi:hypothetical protein
MIWSNWLSISHLWYIDFPFVILLWFCCYLLWASRWRYIGVKVVYCDCHIFLTSSVTPTFLCDFTLSTVYHKLHAWEVSAHSHFGNSYCGITLGVDLDFKRQAGSHFICTSGIPDLRTWACFSLQKYVSSTPACLQMKCIFFDIQNKGLLYNRILWFPEYRQQRVNIAIMTLK